MADCILGIVPGDNSHDWAWHYRRWPRVYGGYVSDNSGLHSGDPILDPAQKGVTFEVACGGGSGAGVRVSLCGLGQIGGSLSGAGNSAAATVNLTAEGTADWVHWGDTALNRKSGVSTPQIGNYTLVGSGQVLSYSNDPRTLSWTDGTPSSSASNANGLYISALQNGFSFTAAADSNTRSLTVHVGGYYSGGTLTAHLSDASAADYVDTTAAVTGQYDRNYTLS